METIQLLVDAFLDVFYPPPPPPYIGEQNERRVPLFPTKIRHRACQDSRARAFHSIFITAHAPSKRELGGHPVRKARGECKCGLGANAPRCTWGI